MLTAGGDSTSTSFAGTIVGGGALVKVGAGTFTLSRANTYAGGTTVSAGTLMVAGQSGSASGTGTGRW
ncbi:MAG: autotransporter-associated beta strand repeat-containing protein [Gemmataceae bacterium]